MAASSQDVDEFLGGPLVTWLSTCVKKPEALQVYETFFDGGPINEVLLQIDPQPSQPVPTMGQLGLGITTSRVRIFHCLIRNIRAIYEDELEQLMVASPDCIVIGRAPSSQQALENLKLLILLLLGCAVQGPTKEVFITRIKELPLEAQHEIVECIKQVTVDQTVVLTQDLQQQKLEKLYQHVRMLTAERDVLFQQWVTDLGQDLPTGNTSFHNTSNDGFESNHLAVELADWKARLRKQRQELEEKTEVLTECKEELEHSNMLVARLKAENTDLLAEARKAKVYRDEVDAMRERAERVDKLEAEAQRYRERLADTDFYRVRVAELREDNRVLLETREMLETQIAKARQRAEHVLELEAEVLACKSNINEISLERDADREKIQELADENFQLQQVAKSALQETSNVNISFDSDNEEYNSGDNSLSEQLTNTAQTRVLKLEFENQKLQSTIDSLKEHNFHESSKKILELEKEKKKLELKQESLLENLERVKQQNQELEELFRDSIQENRKLQTTLDTNKIIADRQAIDLQNEKIKVEELEKNIDGLTKEKQRVQALYDNIKKRADDVDKTLVQITEQLQSMKDVADQSKLNERANDELKEKVTLLEKENGNQQREIVKLKETIELKDRTIDEESEKSSKQEKEISRLLKDSEQLNQQVERMHDYEQKSQELTSQAAVFTETVTTLQKDLITEKVTNEKYKTMLEKLGLTIEIIDYDVNVLVEKMFNNADVATKFLTFAKEKLPDETERSLSLEDLNEWNKKIDELTDELNLAQQLNQRLKNEHAKMQVDVSTLSSQINSLQTQQTALQLANSQLVAEKDELVKLNETRAKQHDTLLLDQVTMRTLHEQLNSEYESLKLEQELIKKVNRDMRIEVRTLKDANLSMEKSKTQLEQEKESLKTESKSLSNLRTEHSKLKDDFRHLFTTNERLKSEYRGLQEENKQLKSESSRLRLGNTEMQGELNTRSDLVTGLQLDNAKLQQRCEILFEMNQSLDADRRALMEHVSKLLSQYHSLLLHSLEDTQHYHSEEKLFNDKLNNLCRQKEKLEEKIMEHYRKLDNASTKKKGFGANFVRRVRKAGTDVMNKIPRNRRSWHEDAQRMSQSQIIGGGSGESAGNDSDNSTEDAVSNEHFRRGTSGSLHGHKPRDEIALRRSHRDLTAHRNSIAGDQVYSRESPAPPLSLGSVGTRRTVYISEDDPPQTTPPATTANQTQPAPPLLVYNKISTIIGGVGEQRATSSPQQNNALTQPEDSNEAAPERPAKKGDNAKENAIWYEYGCV